MRRALGVFLLSATLVAVCVPGSGPLTMSADASPTSWTIMLYMAANASPELPWEQNLNDMEAANQAQGTNIIALVEPLGENTTLYKIAHDPGGLNSVIVSPTIDDGGVVIPVPENNANMGSPGTLESFIEYSASNYPADMYVLILWGHGASWRGLCPDGTDILTLPELRSALANATATIWTPLDLVCIDACAGTTLEMLFEVWEYTKFFVGSEKDIPSQGLPYSRILNDLAANVNCTAQEFGTTIAEDYLSWSRTYSAYSATMSVFNMTSVYPLMNQLRGWVEVGTKLEGLFHAELQTAFSEAEYYETTWQWQADFGDFGNHLSASDVPLELWERFEAVLDVYHEACVYAGSFDNPDDTDGIRVKESNGAVIYCPSTAPVDQQYEDLKISSTGWMALSHMLRRTAESNTSVDNPWLTYGSTENYGPGLHDTVYVNWPSSYSWLDVWVFRQQPDGLIPCGLFTGSGSNVTVHDVAGNLVISASAGNDSQALSYAQLGPVPVTGKVRIHITLMNVTGQDELVSVAVRAGNKTAYVNSTMRINSTTPTSFMFQVYLLTPQNLTVGQNVEIQVDVGKKMAGNGSAIVKIPSTMVTIEMRENPSDQGGLILLLTMAVLAACIVLVFVFLLRRERKK